MANVLKLKVEVSKATTNEGVFFNKLVGAGKKIKTFAGMVEGAKRTFYMFSDTLTEVGTEGELDLDNFDIVPKEFAYVDEETGVEEIAKLSYLYPKRQ